MKVTCKVASVNVAKAIAKASRAKRLSRIAMVEAARMDTLPYVPWVSGDLALTADTESRPEAGKLIYGNSAITYARAQYYTMPNKTRLPHPQATMQWFVHAKAARMAAWERVAQRVYNAETKG